MHMLLQSAHLLKEEYFYLGTSLLLSLFTRLLITGRPCCLAAFPGASSEMKAEVSLPVSPIRWQRIGEDSRFLVGFLKKVLLIAMV